jgi:hypothetical protein
MEIQPRELCLKLVNAESEKEVVRILDSYNLWNNSEAWLDYGGVLNNWGQGGNQQDEAEAALVEKLVNSIDAMLMKECLLRKIDPEDRNAAPNNMKSAVEEFYGIRGGALETLTGTARTQLAENIILMMTGKKKKPCVSIIDKGEGQTPSEFKNTLVSLGRTNKVKIPFVQGVFNQGGTGAIAFCGEHGLQLILSKRNSEIAKMEKSDTKDLWGFTIVRLFPPDSTMRNYVIKYLAPTNGEIMTFSEPLPLLPGKYPQKYAESLESGTMVKLYDYNFSGSYWSDIRLNLFFRLSFLLPRLALPVRMVERRGYGGEKHETTLAGLSVRLEEQKAKTLEVEPYSGIFTVQGQKLKYTIYVFKKETKAYTKDEAVAWVHNGQVQGNLSFRVFQNDLAYIAKTLLVMVNFDDVERAITAKLFMGSRDRLRKDTFFRELNTKVRDIIITDKKLKELNNKRRQDEKGKPMEQDEQFLETIEDLINRNLGLEYLFDDGMKIHTAFDLREKDTSAVKWNGKTWPTFFDISWKRMKEIPKGQTFRVRYNTDAVDSYLDRADNPGEFSIEGELEDYQIVLRNGLATLTIIPPKNVDSGKTLKYKTTVTDPFNKWEHEFEVTISDEPIQSFKGESWPAQPPALIDGHRRKVPRSKDLPELKEIRRHQWGDIYNEWTVIRAVPFEGKYDLYINMDNQLFLDYFKRSKTPGYELEQKYKRAMYLVTLALLRKHEVLGIKFLDAQGEIPKEEVIGQVTRALSPVIMPIIMDI